MSVAETYARTVVMAETESVINRFIGGRIKSISVAFHLHRLSDLRGVAQEDAFQEACKAYNRWLLAPDQATRELLDEAIETLCGGPR